MIKGRILILYLSLVLPVFHYEAHSENEINPDRKYWISVMTRLADPVLENLSKGELTKNMKVEQSRNAGRESVARLEALGRLAAGIAPWLELGPDDTWEGKLRNHYRNLLVKSISNAMNPGSPDYLLGKLEPQHLVDMAYLAEGLMRAPRQVWAKLSEADRNNVYNALMKVRIIVPTENNWLLFSSICEAFLLKNGQSYYPGKIEYAVKKHLEWYKGDGIYGDGGYFQWDYYNSYVIHPMLLEVLEILVENKKPQAVNYQKSLERARRYAEILERLISPEGTFPSIGRSTTYRFGAFHALSFLAIRHQLPNSIKPAQVRCALTAVIRRSIEAEGTFSPEGWLTIGLSGHQPSLGDYYITSGSVYLCTLGLLPLGLPESDEFWAAPDEDWTQKKIWNGKDMPADKGLKK